MRRTRPTVSSSPRAKPHAGPHAPGLELEVADAIERPRLEAHIRELPIRFAKVASRRAAMRAPHLQRHLAGGQQRREFNPSWSWYRGNASATALFEMTGGLRYTYRGSWCADGEHTSWESTWRAVGPNGSAVWNGQQAPQASIVRATGGFHSEVEHVEASAAPAAPEGIRGALNDFLAALDTGSVPMGECHDNIRSLAMVFAALESAARRERVRVEL